MATEICTSFFNNGQYSNCTEEKLLLTLLVAKATWGRGGKIEVTTAICSADCQNHSISAILYDLYAK